LVENNFLILKLFEERQFFKQFLVGNYYQVIKLRVIPLLELRKAVEELGDSHDYAEEVFERGDALVLIAV
jgi:hypothetical protein